jgi:Protein of unknown function (DUF3037)
MTNIAQATKEHTFAFHILRYTSDMIRDEWVNIGVLLFDPLTGDLRLRLVEGQDEFSRIRRLQPRADEDVIRQLRDHLEDRFATFLRNERQERGTPVQPGEALQDILVKWDQTLSNGVQLAQQKGVYADDLDAELERLYAEHVAPPRRETRVGAPGSRAMVRDYCSQVWRQAQLWDRIERAVRISEFTFPGDPMRLDYGYRKNGTRGFVHTLSVSRAPADCKLLAYTADRIARRAAFPSEFTAVTDVELQPELNERHRFVRDTLRDAGIESLDMSSFAAWVPKLKAQMH